MENQYPKIAERTSFLPLSLFLPNETTFAHLPYPSAVVLAVTIFCFQPVNLPGKKSVPL